MNQKQFLHASIPFDICMYKEGKTPLRLHCGNYNTLVDNEKRIAIVHPLSDLTKLIIHNGEKFVPTVNLGWNTVTLSFSASNIKMAVDTLTLREAQKLIEWHFDIASLIEKGEAIDVNTLSENPYK